MLRYKAGEVGLAQNLWWADAPRPENPSQNVMPLVTTPCWRAEWDYVLECYEDVP